MKAHPFFAGIDWENLQKTEPPKHAIISPFKKETPESAFEFKVELGLVEPGTTNVIGEKIKKENSDEHHTHTGEPKLIMSGVILKKCGWLFYKERKLELYDNPPKLKYYWLFIFFDCIKIS